MNITIGFGWWLAPMFVTGAALGWYLARRPRQDAGGYYGSAGTALARLIYFTPALVISLVAWLIWAVLT